MTTPATTPADGELLPCPFCGGKAKLARHENPNRHDIYGRPHIYSIDCMDCAASAVNRYDRDVSIADWNRRAIPSLAQSSTADVLWPLIEKYADAVSLYNEAVRIDVDIDKAGYECLEIERQLGAALATPSPGKADTERFAFLIERGLELIACECQVGPPRMWTLGGLSQSIGWFPTQREAIDAAIQQERDKQ